MSIFRLAEGNGLTENRVWRWGVLATDPDVIGVGRWFIQVGSPRPFCVEGR
jgi:hypothetical protein